MRSAPGRGLHGAFVEQRGLIGAHRNDNPHDGVLNFVLAQGDRGEHRRRGLILGFHVHPDGVKRARMVGDEFPHGFTARNFREAETLRLVLLAEIDPLQRSGVHHRRQPSLPGGEILVFVDVPERDVIPGRLRHRAFHHGHVASEHDRALGAESRAGDGKVPGEDPRRILASGAFREFPNVLSDFVAKDLLKLRQRFALVLLVEEQPVAGRVRHPGEE